MTTKVPAPAPFAQFQTLSASYIADPRLESSAIVIALTGSSYTTGAANDVIATWFEVNAMN